MNHGTQQFCFAILPFTIHETVCAATLICDAPGHRSAALSRHLGDLPFQAATNRRYRINSTAQSAYVCNRLSYSPVSERFGFELVDPWSLPNGIEDYRSSCLTYEIEVTSTYMDLAIDRDPIMLLPYIQLNIEDGLLQPDGPIDHQKLA